MSSKAEIIASIEAAKADMEAALDRAVRLPDLDWGTVRCTAHCLGNYLNITSACVQLLEMTLEGHPDQEVRGWLRALARTTEMMIYLSRQLTNASAASDVPLHPEKVDLALMAARAAAFYDTMANTKDLRFHCEAGGPAYVWADRVALAAVLDNLLSNATKYSPRGKRVRVAVKAEPGQVVCSVEDEGPGLSAEDQAKLFQKGVRLSTTPTAGESSTGFGLYIARRLIERMGGGIGCEAAPGRGCKFAFRLPAFEERQPGEDREPGPGTSTAPPG